MMKRFQLLIPPPVLLAIAASLAYGLAYLNTYWLVARLPYWLNSLLWPVVLLACVVGAVSLLPFMKKRTTINPHHPERSRQLIIDGLYRYSRNPMYLSLLLLLTAWCFHLQALLSLLSILVFVYLINELQIKPEEAVLDSHFGEQYQQYCRKVRRWL
ncbi:MULTISPECIES: methyltransferase family protein [unclassified Agarivorans]